MQGPQGKCTCTRPLLVPDEFNSQWLPQTIMSQFWAGGSRNSRSHLWSTAALKLLHHPDSCSAGRGTGEQLPPSALQRCPHLVCVRSRSELTLLALPGSPSPGWGSVQQQCPPLLRAHTSAWTGPGCLPGTRPPQRLQGKVLLHWLKLNLGKSSQKFTSVPWNSHAKIMHSLSDLTCTSKYEIDSRIRKFLSGGTCY